MARQSHNATYDQKRVPRLREWASWLALFALLVQNVVPFGNALAIEPGTNVDYQIVCTTTGIKQVPLGDDGAPVDPKGAEFCPFCFITTAPAFIEPVAELAIERVEHGIRVAVAIAPNADLSSVWRGLPRPSRAPPLYV